MSSRYVAYKNDCSPFLVSEVYPFDYCKSILYAPKLDLLLLYFCMKFIGMCNRSRQSVTYNYCCFPFFSCHSYGLLFFFFVFVFCPFCVIFILKTNNLVIVCDIFMKAYRNMNNVNTMSGV